MGIDIRLPHITGTTEREQLEQLKKYLFQLREQLQWAFDNIGEGSNSVYVSSPTMISSPVSHVSYSAEETFNSIKALIIKSADIVEAYYDEISTRLEGVYVAESDFGMFAQQTKQDINKSSTDIEQAFTNIQTIITDIGNVKGGIDGINGNIDEIKKEIGDVEAGISAIKDTIIAVYANIKSGILYYESGIPVYGLEIGQKTKIDGVEVFNKFARFTSDRLSFYDQNGSEVAYISDRKLYINHIEVKGSLKMGRLIQTALADGSIVKKWVSIGGEG